MLPSKIEDFPIFGGSKRLSKFHAFLHRFFWHLGSVLASNMGPSWGPRRLKIRKKGSKNLGRSSPRAVLDTNLLLKTVQEPLGLDFWGGQGSIFDDFWMIFGTSWLTLAMFSAALAGGASPRFALVFVVLGEVFSQLCQENPRTCRGQSRESKNLPRTKPRTKSVQTPTGKIKSQSFVLLNSFPYRTPPYSENVGRRYSPQGGFNPPDIR